MNKITKFRIIFNLSGIIIILFLILSLIQKDLVLSGKLIIKSELKKRLPMISVLFPVHRLKKENDYFLIKEEPVYFTVRSPIKFDQAEVEVEFQNENKELINLGIAINGEEKNSWSFKNHTLYNQTLNNINWSYISDGINTLYQKEEKFNNLNDFIKISNTIEGVGAYDFDLGEKFIIHNYQSSDEKNIIKKCLRGEHKFYTYIKNEALDFTFKIQDINRTDGADPLIISVYNSQNKKIYSRILSDDGFISKSDPASLARYISVYLNGLTEGVYKIELSANDDIFIRQISTKQQKIVFIDRLYLCDNPEYSDGFIDLNLESTEVYTNSRLISFYTAHNSGLQTIVLDNKALNISKKHKWFKIYSNPKLSKIFIPKNDLKISARGIFALEKKQYFNPEIINLKDYSNIEEVNYIIAQYQKPKKLTNGWLKNKVTFNLDNAKIENGNLKFILSIPSLNQKNKNIKIKSLKITLKQNNKLSLRKACYNFWNAILNKFKTNFNINDENI